MSDVVKVFLSSTAIDMKEHREKVLEALLRLGHFPVMMESFSAIPKPPVEVCRQKVVGCDAFVAMIAHRYGWVPGIDDGGDGIKSMTWIEVETAIANNIPVFAFIVDDTFGWSLPKEQDLLRNAKDQYEAVKIFGAVQLLQDFKKFLNSGAGLTTEKFTTAENLASKVTASISQNIPTQTPRENSDKVSFDEYLAAIEHNKINKSALTSDLLIGREKNDIDQDSITLLLKTERLIKEFIDKGIEKESLGEEEQLEHFDLCRDNKIYKGTFLCIGKRSQINDICPRSNESMFFVYDGIDKTNLIRTHRVSGNLITQFYELFKKIKKELYLNRLIETSSSDYEIPQIAIREILANAFVHRDYALSMGTTIEVGVFNDRIEIQNPGELMAGVKIGDIQTKEVSLIRNPEISIIFWILDIIEKAGSGILRANKELQKNGLQSIRFSVDSECKVFKAVLFRPDNLQKGKYIYSFRTVHPLQPAPHFRGRKALLNELYDWWLSPVTPDRVRSLVAIGGTGKTAVAERFIDSIKNVPLNGSVLVWSFYDEPNTDAFLREACITFSGQEPEGVGGMLERLQRALVADNRQNLIVLDGLERVQSEGRGAGKHARGELEDHRLKNLLRAIAG